MLELREITVRFDTTTALDSVTLTVGAGEIVAVLGPSGCGKSTMLRVAAGLQPPQEGTVHLEGRDITMLEAHRRGVGLMFQDHALFGHRDVAANVAFGLKMRGATADEQQRRVAEVLELVGLAGMGDRDVATLSGGEAQRVALARSLAARPSVLLLDEPFGSLDRRLRDRLVDEVPSLLRELGTAAVHVTHDHDEAFAVADRLVVMVGGTVRVDGRPEAVWRDPGSVDVARFLGHANIFDVGAGGLAPWGLVSAASGVVLVRSDAFTLLGALASDGESRAARDRVQAKVSRRRFRSERVEIVVRTTPGDVELVVHLDADSRVDVGDEIVLAIDPAGAVALS